MRPLHGSSRVNPAFSQGNKSAPELSYSAAGAMDAPVPSSRYEECLILGEESAADGKAWYLCSSKPDDPAIECAEDYDAIANADPNYGGHDWVCKVPKSMYV